MCECDAKTEGDKDFYRNCIDPNEPEESVFLLSEIFSEKKTDFLI